MQTLSRLGHALGSFNEGIGKFIAWLTLPMVFGTFAIAVLRYVFHLGWIWMQEGVVWMHAVVFMLGCAYALRLDEHVRVDIFYRDMSAQRKAWVNLLGTLLFLLPMSVFLIYESLDYVAASWANHEGSREAGGLPFPFVPVLKSVIPAAFVLVLLQGIAMLIESLLVIGGRESAAGESPVPRQL